MGSPISRAVPIAACALAALGIGVLGLPRSGTPEVELGTHGPAPSPGEADHPAPWSPGAPPHDGGPADASSEEQEEVATVETVSDTTVAPASATTVSSDPPTTATTSPPTTTTAAPAPRHLRDRVVFYGNGPSPVSVWSMLLDGTGQRLEHECGDPRVLGFSGYLDVSPDGTELVRDCGTVVGTEPVPGADYGLVVHDVASGTTRALLDRTVWDTLSARWSPDGTTLAVTGFWARADVVLVDMDTGARRTLVPALQDWSIGPVSWSPDGTRLVTGRLEVIDAATGGVTDLATLLPPVEGATHHVANTARWAADGWIYVHEQAGADGVPLLDSFSRVDPASGAVERLFTFPAWVGWFEQLPDGRWIATTEQAFATFRSDGSGWTERAGPRTSYLAVARPT